MSEKIRVIYNFFAKTLAESVLKNENESEKKLVEKRHQKILLVYGDSQYDVLPNFVEGLKKGFQKLDYDVFLWDCKKMKTYGYNIYQNTIGYDYIILMNGVMIEYMSSNRVSGCPRLWYENSNTKVAAIFVDHPRRHAERLKYVRKGIEIFYADPYWCEYIRKYMPQIANLHYLSLGGTRQREKIYFKDKENKIVFFGSETDLFTISEKINQSEYKDVIWEIIDELIKNPQYTVEEAMRQIGRKNRCLYSMESLMIHSEVLLIVEIYIRGYFRNLVVTEIAKSGIPFDIYGWKSKDIEQYENVTLKEKVTFKKMLDICQNTRFVLNVQPWAKGGVQERVFNTMLGKSIAVTDVSDSLEQEFQDEKNIIFYNLEEIEKLPEKIKYYMEHLDRAMEIAQNGYEIANERHTWDNYAKEMMELLKV